MNPATIRKQLATLGTATTVMFNRQRTEVMFTVPAFYDDVCRAMDGLNLKVECVGTVDGKPTYLAKQQS